MGSDQGFCIRCCHSSLESVCLERGGGISEEGAQGISARGPELTRGTTHQREHRMTGEELLDRIRRWSNLKALAVQGEHGTDIVIRIDGTYNFAPDSEGAHEFERFWTDQLRGIK